MFVFLSSLFNSSILMTLVDSFEWLCFLESLSQYTKEQNINRYTVCFADRKMWDSSWDPTVHPKYINHIFEDGPEANLNPNQAKSRMSIENMNKILVDRNDKSLITP